MEKFSADIVYHNQYPDFITLRIKGELNIGTLEQVEKTMDSIFPTCGGKNVLFDLTDTDYVSSSGWSLFLFAYKRIQGQGGKFLLTGMNTEVFNAFELLEFHFMDHYPDTRSAFREGVKEPALALPGRSLNEKLGKF